MKKSQTKKIIYATIGVIGMFLISSLIIFAADMFVRDEYGNLLEIHEDQPGVYTVISSYQPNVNGLVADNVNTSIGLTQNRANMITTYASVSGTPT